MMTKTTLQPDPAHFVEENLLLERQLCFALSVAARSVVAAYLPVLERLGLTHPQYLVMLGLREKSQELVRKISDELDVELATASPLLRWVESVDSISRRRAAGNERSLVVELTAVGAVLREEAVCVPEATMRKRRLERENVVQLHEAMTRFIVATYG